MKGLGCGCCHGIYVFPLGLLDMSSPVIVETGASGRDDKI